MHRTCLLTLLVSSIAICAPAACPPAAPVAMGPSVAYTEVQFSVSWTAVEGATKYLVERSSNAMFLNLDYSTLFEGSLTSIGDATLTHRDVHFYYRIAAITSECGTEPGPFSNVVEVLVKGDETESPTRTVIPVAGTVQGDFGSLFRTSLQLYNPSPFARSTGTLVFRRPGTSPLDDHPTLPFDLGINESLSIPDLGEALGIDGLGSVDLVVESGELPLAVARIWVEGPLGGTFGLRVSAIPTHEALRSDEGVIAILVPDDLVNQRFNVGVRALGAGVTLHIAVMDRMGVEKKRFTRRYEPDWYIQTSADEFAGITLAEEDTISVAIYAGSAILYGTVTDNVTNDPAIDIVKAVTLTGAGTF